MNEESSIKTADVINKICQKQKRLSSEEVDRLIKLYKSGGTVYELANEFGCNRQTVSLKLKSRGVKMRRQKLSEKQVEEIIRLYNSGLSCVKVGKRLGVDAATVHNYLVRRDIPRRNIK